MGVAAIAFVVLIALGVPIAFVLGLSSVIYMLVIDNTALFASMPQRMFNGLQNYGLLAIPLFVLVGELMNYGGITTRLVHFATVVLGHLRGGLAYVNVVANTFLASIMGSANAQTAMMSRVLVPEMEKVGYRKDFSTALTAASSLIGPIIPPSMPFIIYGVTAEQSIAELFVAGIIPGILLAIGFGLLIYITSLRQNFPKAERMAPVGEMVKAFLAVLPALLVPVVILVGIMTGAFTATESAAVASFIAFLVGVFFYRELRLRDIPKMLLNTAVNTAIVTFLMGTATLFGWVLAFERVPQLIANALISFSENPIVFLLLVNVLFLFLGMVIEGLAALIILVPVLLPVAVNYGIDPVRFGIIICVNLTIGLITPPVGTAMFIASSITKVRFETLARAMVPFILVALAVLAIITYIPPATLWIPQLLGFR